MEHEFGTTKWRRRRSKKTYRYMIIAVSSFSIHVIKIQKKKSKNLILVNGCCHSFFFFLASVSSVLLLLLFHFRLWLWVALLQTYDIIIFFGSVWLRRARTPFPYDVILANFLKWYKSSALPLKQHQSVDSCELFDIKKWR